MDQNESWKWLKWSKINHQNESNGPKSMGRMCQNHPKSAKWSKIERTWSLKWSKWTKRKHQNEWKWIEIAQNEWNYQNRDKPVVQNEVNEPKWIIKMNENGSKSLKMIQK